MRRSPISASIRIWFASLERADVSLTLTTVAMEPVQNSEFVVANARNLILSPAASEIGVNQPAKIPHDTTASPDSLLTAR